MYYSALILEDEIWSQQALGTLIVQNHPDISPLIFASNLQEAQTVIETQKPDILFLDILLNNDSVFDMLEQLPGYLSMQIIFTTAHETFALKAHRYAAVDYVLKPIDRHELANAIEKAKQRIERNPKPFEYTSTPPSSFWEVNFADTLLVPVVGGIELIKFDNILCLEAEDNYTCIVLSDEQPKLSSKNIGFFEKKLIETKKFIRISRSAIVNIGQIKRVSRGEPMTIILNNNKTLSVGKKGEDSIRKIFDH